jgi:hypothetical protein
MDTIDAGGGLDLDDGGELERKGGRELERKKSNEEVIPIHPGDSFLYPLPSCSRKHSAWCLVASPPCSSHRQ